MLDCESNAETNCVCTWDKSGDIIVLEGMMLSNRDCCQSCLTSRVEMETEKLTRDA
jgi:tartrate dehydratase beta subunit/fumarate hydratase class I family protein